MNTPLWQPTTAFKVQSQMFRFMAFINTQFHLNITHYSELHQWSINNLSDFWQSVWKFCSIIATQEPHSILKKGDCMQDSQWFMGARLNLAENLLRYRDQDEALIAISENNTPRSMTYAALYREVAELAARLRQWGITAGDCIVALLPNDIEAVVAMLAVISLGALWSACSPDFGATSLIDRFQPLKPKVLFTVLEHTYKKKTYYHEDKIRTLQKAIPSLTHTILCTRHSQK